MVNQLPLYLHPTEIILVDDDQEYTKNIEIVMLNNQMSVKVFNDPKKALTYIKKIAQNKISEKSVHIEDEYLEKTVFNIDLSNLHKEVYNKDRFKDVSVIIVDYAMPGLNGKQLFEAIQDFPIKKILLTGEEGYDTAVKMFNSGLIDRFFQKSDESLFEKILQEIETLKVKYFQQLTNSVLLSLEKKSSNLPFTDPAVIKLFLEIVKQNDIVEYYALDENGSYILFDKVGKSCFFILKNDEDMQVIYEVAEGEKDVPEEILEALKARGKIPYFSSPKGYLKAVKSWPLYDAKRIVGDHQLYYYAFVKNAEISKSDADIYSYERFLEDHG